MKRTKLPKDRYFMSGKQMREAKWQESVVNSKIKRDNSTDFVISFQCGCGCGTFQFREKKKVIVPIKLKKDNDREKNKRVERIEDTKCYEEMWIKLERKIA